jgi:hypothetical protein
MSKLLNKTIEGYRKTDTPGFIAERFANLVAAANGAKWKPRLPRIPTFLNTPKAMTFPVKGGRVWIDNAKWTEIRSAVETHSGGLIADSPAAGGPAITLSSEEFANRDSELLACDVECRLAGVEGFFLELDIPGLRELIGEAG